MGVALFIVAEREVEGLDVFVNGKALARCDDLDRLAIAAGVRPLMDYLSQSFEDLEEFFYGMRLPGPGTLGCAS